MTIALYDEPRLYEKIHREGTAEEVSLVLDLLHLHGNGGKRLLEPACGTGRLLAALARKGYTVGGYDLSEPALEYAKKRLARAGGRIWKGDMRSFQAPGRWDAAFNLIGTIRHLMTDADVLSHLKRTAAALAPRGLYIVGLDLVDYALAEDDEETWPGHVMMSLAPDRKRRRERIINFVEDGGKVFESSYDLRSYSLEQWRALLAKSPFEVAAEHFYPEPAVPTGLRDALFVLRK